MTTQLSHLTIANELKTCRIQLMRAYLRLYIEQYKKNRGPNWDKDLHKDFELQCYVEELRKNPETVAEKMDFNLFADKVTGTGKQPHNMNLVATRMLHTYSINNDHIALFNKIRHVRNNFEHANGRAIARDNWMDTFESILKLLKAVDAPEYHYVENIRQKIENYDTQNLLPKVNGIEINQVYYTILENTETGGKSIVMKLQNLTDNTIWALKCLNRPENLMLEDENDKTNSIGKIVGFEWMRDRKILTYTNNKELVKKYGRLQNAVLMPWLSDAHCKSWFAFKRAQLSSSEPPYPHDAFIKLAFNLATALKELEIRGFAHGDINSTNVFVNLVNPSVQIIDVEDMYYDAYSFPINNQSAGTPGYQFKSNEPVWHKDADRFAGALLICEMLCWHDLLQHNITRDEYLFDQLEEIDERDESCQVYGIIIQSLNTLNPSLAKLFETCWRAKKIEDCPEIADWHQELEKMVSRFSQPLPQPEVSQPAPAPQPVGKSIPQNNERPATSDTPVLVLFVLDHSDSMEGNLGHNKKRYDDMYSVVHEVLHHLQLASTKGASYSPRYHVGVFTYGKSVHNFLSDKKPLPDIVRQTINPHTNRGIWQINQLYETMKFTHKDNIYSANDFLTFQSVRKQANFDGNGTNMVGMFELIHSVLTQDNLIQEYNRCAPPYIIHITDGCSHSSARLLKAFEQVTELKTKYGELLVSTIFIGETILEKEDVPTDLRQWPGVTDKTVFQDEEYGNTLRSITSKIPKTYLNTLQANGYNLEEHAYFFFPSNNKDMIKLAITAAMATVGIKR